ncbi:MAG: serine/threonine-protein kinase, partial [Myxococcota bacterium]
MKTLDEARGLMEHGQALDELDFQRALANVASNLLGDGGPPPQVGRFSLRDRVGAGGMGVVYSAFDPQLDRTVAIKLLHPDATDGGGDPAGPDAHELLLREARSLAKLRHPNVVTIHEVGTEGRRLFLAMEFIAGEPLDSWMRTSPPWQEVVAVLRDAGQGLAAAHDAGIVHRDFKPSNVILGEDGRVTVIDFGLARVDSTAQPTNDDAHEGAMSSAPLTQRGAVV